MNYDDSTENVPLLRDERSNSYGEGALTAGTEENVEQRRTHSGATVTCRVCEATIELEGRNTQHVVKCATCHEATPIRPAPAGKKYVRCPCNCLLICKAASTRIACPRSNCRRVITLGHREPQGSAVRAPAGFFRVNCAYCNEVFLFNTNNNSLAQCPHCKRFSTVGSFARRRALAFLLGAVVMLLLSVVLTAMTISSASQMKYMYAVYALSYGVTLFLLYRFVKYWTIKVSNVIGPI